MTRRTWTTTRDSAPAAQGPQGNPALIEPDDAQRAPPLILSQSKDHPPAMARSAGDVATPEHVNHLTTTYAPSTTMAAPAIDAAAARVPSPVNS